MYTYVTHTETIMCTGDFALGIMCIYRRIFMCIYIYIYTHIRVYIGVYLCASIYIYTHIRVYAHKYTPIYTYNVHR